MKHRQFLRARSSGPARPRRLSCRTGYAGFQHVLDAVGNTLGRSVLPAVLVELRKRHPGMRIITSVMKGRTAVDHAIQVLSAHKLGRAPLFRSSAG